MNDTAEATTLVLRRTIGAPAERVFKAWTEPGMLQQWFGPTSYTVPEARIDARAGGTYRIVFEDDKGECVVVKGSYREFREPERLSFTWTWEEDDGTPEHESLVTIELHPLGTATELVLTHERLASEISRDSHRIGWTETLDELAPFLAAHLAA
jgi:uncharacterized protein YndB with AHSA1/START domain